MSKKRREVIGSILKSKTGSGSYIKIRGNVTLNEGDTLNLDSKTELLSSLNDAVKNGKLSEEYGEKRREQIEKIPDFVRFEISRLVAAPVSE